MLRPVCILGRYVYRTSSIHTGRLLERPVCIPDVYTALLHFGLILAAWYFVVFPSHSSILSSIDCKAHNFTMAEAEQEHKRLFDERVGTLIENKKCEVLTKPKYDEIIDILEKQAYLASLPKDEKPKNYYYVIKSFAVFKVGSEILLVRKNSDFEKCCSDTIILLYYYASFIYNKCILKRKVLWNAPIKTLRIC